MGRKGVSKRKPTKTKSGPVSIGGSSAGSFGAKMTENLPVQPPEKSIAVPSNPGRVKPSSKR
jgi:hypothetical protein